MVRVRNPRAFLPVVVVVAVSGCGLVLNYSDYEDLSSAADGGPNEASIDSSTGGSAGGAGATTTGGAAGLSGSAGQSGKGGSGGSVAGGSGGAPSQGGAGGGAAGCGSSCGGMPAARTACISGVCTPAQRVFICDMELPGALMQDGGVQAANSACTSAGSAAQTLGVWKAWVSVGTDSPSKWPDLGLPIVMMDGTLVADSWPQLLSAGPLKPISIAENAQPYIFQDSGHDRVWTATDKNGVGIVPPADCVGFTSALASDRAVVGDPNATGAAWTDTGTTESCDRLFHLYCFEQ